MPELTEEQIELHNKLYGKACDLTEGRLFLDGSEPLGQPGWLESRKLRKAEGLFRKALVLNPGGWQSMLLVGKIHQRLDDQESALRWMMRANRIVPDNVSVAKEIGLTASDLGKYDVAIQVMETAATTGECDAPLLSNLGMVYLLNNRASDAQAAFDQAVSGGLNDDTTRRLLRLAASVAEGNTSCPTTEEEIVQAIQE